MIEVRDALLEEVSSFVEMEKAEGTAEFIIPHHLERHIADFSDRNTIYLSVIDGKELVGFMILVLDLDGTSVEFRRIVITTRNKGIGQSSVTAMENYCRTELGREWIWLDVFEFNERGRHIYERLRYIQFKKGEYEGKPLLFYEKILY